MSPVAAPCGLNLQFLDATLEPDASSGQAGAFSVVAKRFLRIDVDGAVWIKRGSAVAYRGILHFGRERVIQGDGRGVARECVPLARVTGKGHLICADEGKRSVVLRVEDEPVDITGTALLAFEASLQHQAHLVGTVGLAAGGLFAVRLSGTGLFALAPKGDPLTLRVTPEAPLVTDPDATVAWTGGVKPCLKTEFDWRGLIGHGGGDAVQMLFRGDGYVVIQSKEEDPTKRALFGHARSILKRFVPLP
jgi:uncharacterized protein (AIM24 family)